LLRAPAAMNGVVLLGPCQIGKTTLLAQAVQRLLDERVEPKSILYVSLAEPAYIGLTPEEVVRLFLAMHGHGPAAPLTVLLDGIEYLPGWEAHLATLIDLFPATRFCASGSVAPKPGVGRWIEYLLPPLSFAEFVDLTHRTDQLFERGTRKLRGIAALNRVFVEYLNLGGFPAPLFDDTVRDGMEGFAAGDIVARALLHDGPSVYGIADPAELKQLLASLARDPGAEVSVEALSQQLRIAKNTVRKYLDYLEASFLTRRVHRVDGEARRFQRATHFKVYLTNSSLRAALFGAVDERSEAIEGVAQSAYFAELFRSASGADTFYARWDGGEIAAVGLDPAGQHVRHASEIRWDDGIVETAETALRPLLDFCKRMGIGATTVTTKTARLDRTIDGIEIGFWPLAQLVYEIARIKFERQAATG